MHALTGKYQDQLRDAEVFRANAIKALGGHAEALAAIETSPVLQTAQWWCKYARKTAPSRVVYLDALVRLAQLLADIPMGYHPSVTVPERDAAIDYRLRTLASRRQNAFDTNTTDENMEIERIMLQIEDPRAWDNAYFDENTTLEETQEIFNALNKPKE